MRFTLFNSIIIAANENDSGVPFHSAIWRIQVSLNILLQMKSLSLSDNQRHIEIFGISSKHWNGKEAIKIIDHIQNDISLYTECLLAKIWSSSLINWSYIFGFHLALFLAYDCVPMDRLMKFTENIRLHSGTFVMITVAACGRIPRLPWHCCFAAERYSFSASINENTPLWRVTSTICKSHRAETWHKTVFHFQAAYCTNVDAYTHF